MVFRVDGSFKSNDEMISNMYVKLKIQKLKELGYELSTDQIIDRVYCLRHYSIMFDTEEEAALFKLTHL